MATKEVEEVTIEEILDDDMEKSEESDPMSKDEKEFPVTELLQYARELFEVEHFVCKSALRLNGYSETDVITKTKLNELIQTLLNEPIS